MKPEEIARMPAFIVLGAEKAGTTALHYLLRQHPQIFVAPKEPEFFSFEGNPVRRQDITSLAEYQALFEPAPAHAVCGDVSTTYLCSPEAPQRIKAYVPDARLIAILRNPIERAYSRYWMWLKAHPEELPYTPEKFLRFFRDHGGRVPWDNIRDRGLYAEQLRRYLDSCSHRQIQVVLYEDYKHAPEKTLSTLLEFIGVDPNVRLENKVHGATGRSRSELMRKLIRQQYWPPAMRSVVKGIFPRKLLSDVYQALDEANTIRPAALDDETRKELTAFYRDDILDLQDLLGRDLSRWLG